MEKSVIESFGEETDPLRKGGIDNSIGNFSGRDLLGSDWYANFVI